MPHKPDEKAVSIGLNITVNDFHHMKADLKKKEARTSKKERALRLSLLKLFAGAMFGRPVALAVERAAKKHLEGTPHTSANGSLFDGIFSDREMWMIGGKVFDAIEAKMNQADGFADALALAMKEAKAKT